MENSFSIEVNNDYSVSHLQFFSSIAWLAYAQQKGKVTIDIYETFPKQTFRNRLLLMSSNGLQSISVPVKRSKDGKILMKDAEISYKEDWNIKLWRAVYSNYGKSPFFEYYASETEHILMKKYKYLVDLNVETLMFLKKSFALSFDIFFSDNFIERQEDNFRQSFSCKTRREDGASLQPYLQCFYDKIPFEPNLSALDLLFCVGKQEGRQRILSM